MNKEFHIIVFREDIQDMDWGLTSAIDFYYSKEIKSIQFDISLTEDDFDKSPFVEIVGIINEKANMMLGPFEDDVIYSQEAKLDCLIEIAKKIPDSKLALEIGEAFRWAILKNKNVYFLF